MLALKTSQPRARAAFTLIELLVVVAIIALLMAILLPAMGRARGQAREVKCRTQLREYGKGFQYYLTEWKDYFPPHKHYDTRRGDVPPYWYNLIDRYFKHGEMDLNPKDSGKRNKSLYLARCPDLKGRRQDDGNQNWEWEYDRDRLGYGYNDFWLGCYPNEWALNYYGRVKTTLWRKLVEVKSPAECLLVADSQPKPDGDWSCSLWWPWIAAAGEGVATRHGERGGFHKVTYKGESTKYPDGRGNIAWVDGSATARTSRNINDLAEHRRYWDPGQGVGGW
jgi:prepilin-type N-terminal cleavage/methylation domain-containing protein/prepilin-type processing-associated H-X9-DG protein